MWDPKPEWNSTTYVPYNKFVNASPSPLGSCIRMSPQDCRLASCTCTAHSPKATPEARQQQELLDAQEVKNLNSFVPRLKDPPPASAPAASPVRSAAGKSKSAGRNQQQPAGKSHKGSLTKLRQ